MVTDLKEKYGFEVEILKKNEVGLLKRMSLLRLPVVEVDDRIVSQGKDISVMELERELFERQSTN